MKHFSFIPLWVGILFCLSNYGLSQQVSPLELLLHPDKYKAAITGVGGGDLNSLSIQTGQLSAQGAFEFCFGTHETKKRGNLATVPIILRYNFLNARDIINSDTFSVRSIAFVDNNQMFNIGARIRNLRDISDDRLMQALTFDYSYSNYSILSPNENLLFGSHNVSIGYQLGLLMETNAGPMGILISPSFSYLNVSDDTPGSFQKALGSASSVAKNFAGGNLKVQFQFNDLAIFFDIKRFFPIDNPSQIPGLTDNTVISFGGSALGTIFRFENNN